jgi:hypothetical protein
MALKNNNSFSKLWEQHYPETLAALFSFLAYFLHVNLWINFNIFLDSLLVISSIFVGFLGTSIGIIFSADSDRIRWLRQKKDVWGKTINFFKVAFSLNFLLCISSFLLKSTNFEGLDTIKEFAFLIIVFNCTAAFLAFHRAIYLFFLMLLDNKR